VDLGFTRQRRDVELCGILRYRGTAGSGARGDARRRFGRRRGLRREHRECSMSDTFNKVADIIAETCDIPREKIEPESHAIDDLEIDSLDFLDIAFAIDKAFGIKLPLEQWTQEVNEGKASTEQYFVLKNLCGRIDELIAAKGA
jgi:acyl carrier protein